MSLSNLATELLEFIVEAVSPRDIVSFSQCSRRIRLLCTKRLAEHRELDHTTPRELEIMPLVKINNHTGNEEWSDWGYTLRAIAENRRAGWYMKNLEVVEELRQDCSNSPAGTVAISQSRLEPIWPLLRDSTYLTPHERIEWYRDMLLGQEGPLLALFLSLTPSLRWVSFEWGWRDPYIAKMLGRIATASQRCPQAALSEIPSVGVDQDTLFPDPACLTFLKTWVAVPSVVNIYIHGVILSASLNGTAEETEYLISMGEAADSHAADPATAEATSSQSGVTHLFFSKCNIESLFLSPLLRYFSNLKRVESTFSWFGSVGKVGWSPRLINETLQQYSKDTLEEFRITRDTIRPYPASFDTFISSLASFQALKTVILQFDMLIDRDPGSIQTFSSLLPLSLERLLLLNISETADTSTHITRLLSDFNCTHWPNLRLMSFQCQGPRIPINDLLKPLLHILVTSGNYCSSFSHKSEHRREYKEPESGVDIGFRVEALSSPKYTMQTAPNVFSYIHVEEAAEEVGVGVGVGVGENTGTVSDYLRLENVFDRLTLD